MNVPVIIFTSLLGVLFLFVIYKLFKPRKTKKDFGKDIIKDMLLDIDETKMLEWLEKENELDALQIGTAYNDKVSSDVSPITFDRIFGYGYICALRHMQEIIDNK